MSVKGGGSHRAGKGRECASWKIYTYRRGGQGSFHWEGGILARELAGRQEATEGTGGGGNTGQREKHVQRP